MKNMKKKSPDEDAANDINWDWEDDWVSYKNNRPKKEELL